MSDVTASHEKPLKFIMLFEQSALSLPNTHNSVFDLDIKILL